MKGWWTTEAPDGCTSGRHTTTHLRSAGHGFNLIPPARFTGAFESSDRTPVASEFTEERLSFLAYRPTTDEI